MTGAGKLAATLISGIIMLPALAASGQQPSNITADTRSDSNAASASAAPHVPAEMPPKPPTVTCDGDNLTISAQNSTLGAILNAIRACTGAQIDVPEDAKAERLFAELGPGPLRTVLADFLSSTEFNYVIKAAPSDPQKVQMVLLNPRVGDRGYGFCGKRRVSRRQRFYHEPRSGRSRGSRGGFYSRRGRTRESCNSGVTR